MGVLAYHLGFGWASGGYLGVDLFFVLSGFLITALLTEEWLDTGAIRLRAFWGRRARRLLPALALLLVAVALFVVLDGRFGPPGSTGLVDLSGLRGDGLATLLYVANWHAIFAHQSYFAQFAAPSPFQHTWSLAIEEQFYLVWPPVLFLILSSSRGAWRTVGTGVAMLGALASALAMALLYQPGVDPTRVYFGTDTRVFDMLAGGALAMVVAARKEPGRRARTALHVAGPAAAGALGALWVLAGGPGGLPPGWMFRGGFLVAAVLAVVVIADVRLAHRGPLAVVLSLRPVRWIGTISYGIYLWHWPVFVFMTPGLTGLSGATLDTARVTLTLVIAAGSYYGVERPVRRADFAGSRRLLVPLVAATTAAALVVGTLPAVAAPPGQSPVGEPRPTVGTVAVAGSGGLGSQRPIALPVGRVPTRADPLRVDEIGDSVSNVLEPGITAALGATGVVRVTNNAFPGWGLSTDRSWSAGFRQIVATVRPELFIGTWSWDDSWALSDPAGYRRVVGAFVDQLLQPGDGVSGILFLQFPPEGPVPQGAQTAADAVAATRLRDAGSRAWEAIVRSLVRTHPGRVMFLPAASSILLDGRFTTWLPPAGRPDAPADQWVRVRMVDNVHPCPAGVVRYAEAVLVDFTALYRLPKAHAGWWAGDWSVDPTRWPPGTCPDDHPAHVVAVSTGHRGGREGP